MFRFSPATHRTIYLWCLALIGIFLPLSIYMLSVFQITIAINWIIEKNLIIRWRHFQKTRSLWFIVLFYLIHVGWLINTNNFSFGFQDLKTKLPFLFLPIIIGTSEPIEKKWVRRILYLFILSVAFCTLYSTFQSIKLQTDVLSNIIVISPFISHIHFALMINTSIFILGWLIFDIHNTWIRIGNTIIMLWLTNYLFILQSLTGVVILVIVILLLIIIWVIKSKNMVFRWTMIVVFLTGILLIISYFTNIYTRYFSPLPVDSTTLEHYTIRGNKYWHDITSKYIENGYYTYLYVCDNELRDGWNKRSNYKFEGVDKKGQLLQYILYRYLTSKDLRKDSVGLSKLTDADIRNIENGIPNIIYTRKYGLKARIYQMFWELYHYKLGQNPTGYSVSQRIEFIKTAFGIIKRNFWFGTGTGDVNQEFQLQYELDKTKLGINNRGHAHNQFLTFLITFGIIGFIFILLAIFIPPFLEQKYTDYLFYTFFIIAILSMLIENTLGKHTGISFFAYFYGMFLYTLPNEKDSC